MKRISFLILTYLLALSVNSQELANFSQERGGKPIISPDIQGDVVTFNLKAGHADKVSLYGSWMSKYSDSVEMKKGDNNVWTVSIPVPSPEIYTYNFIVDGVAVNDPRNVLVQRDGTRYLSMLLIDGERTENYKEANERGTISHPWYDSKMLGINRRLTVYTPYGYEVNTEKKYPVLYLLHGAGGDEEAWISMGRAAQILDNLIEKGLAEPMIVVMPNGNANQQAACTLNLPTSGANLRDPSMTNSYVKSLVEEIIPFIEANFRTISEKSSRAIAGLSMGGGHTMAASGLYPDTFDYICPLSMGSARTAEVDKRLQGIKEAGYKLYFLACGNSDFLFNRANEFDKALTANGLEHTYYVSEGGHVWANWRLYLNTFVPLLFK